MNKGMSVALLAVGIVLIIMGVSASESFSSDVSRFFTGSPTDKTVWLLIGESSQPLSDCSACFGARSEIEVRDSGVLAQMEASPRAGRPRHAWVLCYSLFCAWDQARPHAVPSLVTRQEPQPNKPLHPRGQ